MKETLEIFKNKVFYDEEKSLIFILKLIMNFTLNFFEQ